MQIRDVSEQMRNKWRRRSEPMLSVLNQKHQQQQQQKQEMTMTPPLGLQDYVQKEPPSVQQQTESKQDHHQQQNPKVPEGKTHDKKAPLPSNPDTAVFGIGDYQFISQLGEGKFSKVMLAQHYLTGEKFAIKMIDKGAHDDRVMSRLVREIAIMEALNHPNIVRLYETFETAYTIYLVMEYIPGVNLDEYLKQMGGSLSEQEARVIFRQVVTAVDYCHRKWVVHRDLKAPNILLTNNNRVHLVDFGLSNRFGQQRLRTICGSMLYYSPEIINGKKYIGPEVDCWCLGICLFRMIAGFEAFSHAKTIGELRKAILSRNYPMPPHFSDGLKRTIQKCLSTDRRRRSSLCNALQGDPWLNAFGEYGDLFSDASNYHSSMYQFAVPSSVSTDSITLEARKQEREQQQRQFLRDMEEERRSGYKVRKTLIHHAYNPAVYYTGNGRREDRSLLEPARAVLYQEILSILAQVSLYSINSPQLFSLKSPMNLLFRKWKRPDSNVHLKTDFLDHQTSALSPPLLSSSISSASEVNSTHGRNSNSNNRLSANNRLTKKSSALNISQLYQRTKEKIYYFTIQSNARAISSATVVSAASSNMVLSHPDDQNVPISAYSDENRDEFELMLLVRSVCELLGVTYLHESRSQLSCMLTLCGYTDEPLQQKTSPTLESTKSIPRKPSLKQLFSSSAAASTPSLLKKKKSSSNNSLYSESIGDPLDISCDDLGYDQGVGNNSHWWLRQLQRLALPHSNVLQQQQPLRHSSSTKSLRSSAQAALGGLRRKSSFDNFFKSKEQATDEANQIDNDDQSATNEQQAKKGIATTDDTALFAIDVYSIQSRQKDNTRTLALRFTKLSGSTKVFKLATGWIASVLQSKP